MFKFRWKVEKWTEYRDGLCTGVLHIEKPILQVKSMVNFEELGIQDPIWSEWEDVPTETVET